jgi:cytochrome c oxidase subunit 2
VVLLAGVAGFLVYFTASANGRETRSQAPATLPSAPPPVPVAVNAFQWCWEFRYADAPVTVTGACEQGRYPTVVVPAGRPVQFRLASRDVVHSFWIPALNAKMDAFPDHVNNLTMTFDQPGEWLGRCAEYCGTYHTTMDFHIRAVPPEEYQRWLQQHRSAA